jgi:hypothetical protein
MAANSARPKSANDYLLFLTLHESGIKYSAAGQSRPKKLLR